LLNGVVETYRVTFLPNKAAAAQFGGPILPPDARKCCKAY